MTRLRGLAALIALGAVLGGIPWLLLRFGDWPITGIPTGDQLRNTLDTAVTDSTVFAVLTVAAWTVWVVFAISVLIELVAAARGIQAPQLTFAGPLQRSARALVAAIVLAATIHHSTPTASATTVPHGRSAATVVLEAPVVYEAGVLPEPTRHADPVSSARASASIDAAQAATVTVTRGDSAWSIAHAHLGDGMRWRDLWALNHDRPQPDGRAWTDPQVIRVGWILQLPIAVDTSDATPIPASAPDATADMPSVDETSTSNIVIVERGDTLTGIAGQHLGDPGRYREIFELNRDLEQPDGRRLTDPNLIVPGWHLTLPPPPPVIPDPVPTDEQPPVVTDPVTPTPPATEPTTNTPPTTPPTTSPPPTTPAPPAPTPPPPTTNPPPPASTPPPTSFAEPALGDGDIDDNETWTAIAPFLAGVSGAVALASSLLVRIRRGRRRQALRGATARRRRQATPLIAVSESAVVAAANVPFVRWAGQSLANLVARLDARRVTSVPVAVEISPETGIEILWDAPFPDAPLPWTSTNAGWAWVLEYDPDSPVPTDALPAPIPALVTFGERDGRQLLVNLEAFGSVAVTGDPDRVTAFLRSLALELGTGDDLADAYVVTVDLDLPVATERLRADTLHTAIDRIGSFEQSIHAALQTEHLRTTFAYRCGTPNGHLEATVIIAATDSDDADIAQLLAAASAHRSVAVVLTGPAPTAGAQVHIDDDGSARIKPLGLTFTAANLPTSTVEDVGVLLGDAEPLPDLAEISVQLFDPDQPALTSTAADTATPDLHETTPNEPPDEDSDSDVELVRSPLDASLIVRVLGTPRVPDRPNLKRREVALTVFLACRGGQVNASAVQDTLWNGQAVQGKTVWNLVGRTRTALGQLPDGTWVLPPSDRNRRMKGIGDSVTTDLAILRHLCSRAHTVSSSEAIGLLRQGLALVEGPPFDADGYDWAHHGTQDVAEACELIERAVEQLVTLTLDVDDTETARWAITQGLRGLPGDEVLYRLRMQVEHHTGNLPGVTAAYEELVRYLLEFDADPSPSTVELHRQLVRRSRT